MDKETSSWDLKILVIIALLFAIYYSEAVLFPIVFSFFLYLLLNPILEWLVQLRVPKLVASALIVSLLLGLCSLAISFLLQPAASWMEHAPNNFHIIEQKFRFVKKSIGKIDTVAEKAEDLTKLKKKNKIAIVAEKPKLANSLFDLTTNILLVIFSILILLFFELNYFKSFIQNLEITLYKKREIAKKEDFLLSLKNEVSAYLFTFSLICFGLGVLMSIALWLLGLPNAMLWGAMAMMLTFIPYLGHLIGIGIISFVSLISFDNYYHIFAPPLVYLLLTVLEGQIITPILLGYRLNLNPLMVFLSIFIWGWLWGLSGIIISVPLLVTMRIVLEHLPEYAKYKLLLEK